MNFYERRQNAQTISVERWRELMFGPVPNGYDEYAFRAIFNIMQTGWVYSGPKTDTCPRYVVAEEYIYNVFDSAEVPEDEVRAIVNFLKSEGMAFLLLDRTDAVEFQMNPGNSGTSKVILPEWIDFSDVLEKLSKD